MSRLQTCICKLVNIQLLVVTVIDKLNLLTRVLTLKYKVLSFTDKQRQVELDCRKDKSDFKKTCIHKIFNTSM